MLIKEISLLTYHLTKNKKVTIYILAFLFLPGTVIHELSHFLMATLLFVKTGKIEILPKIDKDEITLGSVEIQKTDIFRRMIIGTAPFIFGNTIIFILLSYLTANTSIIQTLSIFITGYVVFQIGNTMFSSKKDLEGMIELLILASIISTSLYLIGARIPDLDLTSPFSNRIFMLFRNAGIYLVIPILIDFLGIVTIKIIRSSIFKNRI